MSHRNMIFPAEDRRGNVAPAKRDLCRPSPWPMPMVIGPYWPIMSGPPPPIQEVRL
jgi:hypothetical protein